MHPGEVRGPLPARATRSLLLLEAGWWSGAGPAPPRPLDKVRPGYSCHRQHLSAHIAGPVMTQKDQGRPHLLFRPQIIFFRPSGYVSCGPREASAGSLRPGLGCCSRETSP